MRLVPGGSAGVAVLIAVVLLACGAVRPAGGSPPGDAGRATVTGHVHWPDCAGAACPPLDDVAVHFSVPSESRHFTTTTGAAGQYSISLPPGTYVVIAGDADRSALAKQVTVGPGDTVTLDLPISPPTGA
jgi:Carboxypeptidase regulatory-like domain